MSRPPIAILVSRFPLVTETFILREIVEIERQGQPVLLVPMIRESPAVIHEAARPWMNRAWFTPWLNTQIAIDNVRAVLTRPFRYIGLLARIVSGTMFRPGTLVRSLALFPKSVSLARRLEREGATHLHAHFATHPTTMALVISAFANIPFSFTVHAHDIQLDRSLLGWKLRAARFVRSISAFNRQFLEALYPAARGKIEVVHVGIDPDAYSHGEPAAGPPRLLCVAAHKPYKGLPVLIEACRVLRDSGVDFRCEIVGDGPMRGELERMIGSRGLAGVVSLAGARTEEQVARMMQEATLFVLPSIIAPDGQMEGIPVALMEAMASGRPVVSTTIAGIPELVEHGVSGLLVQQGDAPALANAIRHVLDDPVRAREMGARGREKVVAEFSLRETARELLELVNDRPSP